VQGARGGEQERLRQRRTGPRGGEQGHAAAARGEGERGELLHERRRAATAQGRETERARRLLRLRLRERGERQCLT
jgi:hypothetical protein